MIENEEIYYSKNVQKTKNYVTMIFSSNVYNIFTAIDKFFHRHKHRILNQNFFDRCFRNFESTILKKINIFVNKFDQKN